MNDGLHNASDDEEKELLEWPSVDFAQPLEEGGPDARKGFTYQDEIAVCFLLEMIKDQSIIKIHCESHDDIVIVRTNEATKQVCAEYVQVKATEPNQLWSIANLCSRKDGKVGTSVLEKSLAHDCHKEQSRFRILTQRQASTEFNILTNPIGSVGRESSSKELQKLKQAIDKRCPSILSPKGNDCGYWLDNCLWDERHNVEAIRIQNQLLVYQISAAQGNALLQDSIDALLDDMRLWVKEAGDAKWNPNRDQKIITRTQLLDWWNHRLVELTSSSDTTGGKLVRKMEAAQLPTDVINLAVDLRRRFTAARRTPRYSDNENTEELLGRVRAEVISLRSAYTAGLIDGDASTFHVKCLEKMDAINNERPVGDPDRSSFLKGCLYDITDRCLLRFDRKAQ